MAEARGEQRSAAPTHNAPAPTTTSLTHTLRHTQKHTQTRIRLHTYPHSHTHAKTYMHKHTHKQVTIKRATNKTHQAQVEFGQIMHFLQSIK